MSLRDFESLTLRDLCDRDLSVQYLAVLLRQRQLALLLGAGVSIGAGLPRWVELVRRCESEVGLSHSADVSSRGLMQSIDRVRRHLTSSGDTRQLPDVVRTALYPDAALRSGQYPDEIMQNRMLIAIGALVMASARGSVGDVFTLNFDDLLEWYLHLHGFSTEVVSEFPMYLRGDIDVTLFHPHGFLPLVESAYPRSEWLLLSHQELVQRLAGADSPWPTLLVSRFLSKRLLAVGTSMNDLDIDVLLARARTAMGGAGDPLGFVVDVGTDRDRREELMEVGLVPIVLADHDEIPSYLLEVCREAARN